MKSLSGLDARPRIEEGAEVMGDRRCPIKDQIVGQIALEFEQAEVGLGPMDAVW